MIRIRLIVDFLVKRHGLTVTPADIEEHLESTAQAFGTSRAEVEKQIETPAQRAQLEYAILENKVLNLFLVRDNKPQENSH
jgi:FKBP-type peptidyl-prolyl cis-trans isomerase (trigger factor)